VQRIWRAHGLQPHRVRQFKLLNDPKFADKLQDVVGLYVDPPAHAIVLSNTTPKRPFRWTADPDKIIAAVRRGHQALDSIH
jgi:hypothetical protein